MPSLNQISDFSTDPDLHPDVTFPFDSHTDTLPVMLQYLCY